MHGLRGNKRNLGAPAPPESWWVETEPAGLRVTFACECLAAAIYQGNTCPERDEITWLKPYSPLVAGGSAGSQLVHFLKVFPTTQTWVVAELFISLTLPRPHHQAHVSSTALTRLPRAALGRKQGQLSCSRAMGPAQLPSYLQSQLQYAAQSRRGAYSSASAWEWLGLLSHSHTHRAGSPRPSPPGPASVAQLKCKVHSPKCYSQ